MVNLVSGSKGHGITFTNVNIEHLVITRVTKPNLNGVYVNQCLYIRVKPCLNVENGE